MTFTSYEFLFLFFPILLGIYAFIPARHRALLLLVASWFFYALWQPVYLVLLITVTAVSFGVGQWIDDTRNPKKRLQRLSVGVVFNLGVLAYFKYSNFGIETLNAFLGGLGLHSIPAVHILLPVGLSFFVFNAISYLVDVHRKQAEPAIHFVQFAAYIAFFAYLLNGPIQRYQKTGAQFYEPTLNAELFGWGAMRFMVGFSKKILIADPLSPLVRTTFTVPDPSMGDAWLGAFAYTIQLYFDFSGYSDMAIGVAAMLGFRLPENFNHPYTAKSITEFWNRWHLSLSTFLRNYLYFPLGGNRKGQLRTYFNLAATMVLGGLWHGAAWTFVLWGAWNGFFLMLERFLKDRFNLPAPPVWYAIPKMMVIVVLGRVLFVSDNLADALNMYAGAFGAHGFALHANVAMDATLERMLILLLGTVLCYVAPHWNALETRGLAWFQTAQRFVVPAFWVAMMFVAVRDFVPFLYFRF